MQKKELSLYHVIKAPTIKKEKTPVIFLFHGYGSNENDLFSFAPELPDELCVISARAPLMIQPGGYIWYSIYFDEEKGKFNNNEEAGIAREKISDFIDEAIQAYDLDADNVTLLGFSQGTILSYAVALSYPHKINNVIALSGYINPDLLAEGYQENDFSKLNIYCSHGSVDQVIPVQWAQAAPQILDKIGIHTELQEFPVGHGVAPQNFYQFKEWLLTKI